MNPISSALALVIAVSGLALSVTAQATQVDPSLVAFGRGETKAKTARVVLLLNTAGSQLRAPARYHAQEVVRYFRAITDASWKSVETVVKASPKLIRFRSLHWINASATVDVTPEGLRKLAKLDAIKKIYALAKIEEERTSRGSRRGRGDSDGLPYDLKVLGMDQLIAEAPEITGKGVILGHIDSGVDATHPLLAGKVLRFFDAATLKVTEPFETEEHGTHTAGTMVGGDRTKNLVGMAPDAKLVSCSIFTSPDTEHFIKGMEFMLNTGGPIPRAINNSWNQQGTPDLELFYKAISAWEAAGILPVFSAGNSGREGPRSITNPHEHPLAFAIGATDAQNLRGDFSSIGPGVFQGQDTKKPDLTAPGVDILSTLPDGRMGPMSGTSMSTPHMTGAVALVLQVNPSLNPQQIRALFIRTATPVDAEGKPGPAGNWNPYYGYGRANVYAAVKAASQHADRRGGRGSGSAGGESMLARLLIPESNESRVARELDLLEVPAGLEDWTNSQVDEPGDAWVDGATL